jgi:anthranilate phosphoribosyltransferase
MTTQAVLVETLTQLIEGESLDERGAYAAMHALIAIGNHATSAAFLSLIASRPLPLPTFRGFHVALREIETPVHLSVPCLDLCGTGGDGKHTFNISTTAAFVVAGAGFHVAKHGNFSSSSVCGSSNLIEALGAALTSKPEVLTRQIEEAGICYLHAPLFRPALAELSTVRRQLGLRTVFNVIGPLLNPARPATQLIGVADAETLRLYTYFLEESEMQYTVVHSRDGYDEVSLTGIADVFTRQGGCSLTPERDFGLPSCRPGALMGGTDAAENAKITHKVLAGEGTAAQRDVVVANSALAIHCKKPEWSLAECVARATESIESGAALRCLKRFVEIGG